MKKLLTVLSVYLLTTVSVLSQDIWTPTEHQINNMVRIIKDLESCRNETELLTARLTECDLLLNRVISERNETIKVLERSEQINTEIRAENGKLNTRIVRLRRQRWWMLGGGVLVGGVLGWFVGR